MGQVKRHCCPIWAGNLATALQLIQVDAKLKAQRRPIEQYVQAIAPQPGPGPRQCFYRLERNYSCPASNRPNRPTSLGDRDVDSSFSLSKPALHI